MRIQHNISAMNSYRQLNTNNSAMGKNLEKLSSGYRINRAGDDAAGLAISEKMRAQIKGLETAQKNANDAISLVQTAEGALTEVHSMLNRMSELATQAANGTYTNSETTANGGDNKGTAADTKKIELEIKQLTEEIDRIAKSTNFNGITLLHGDMEDGRMMQIGAEAKSFDQLKITIGKMDAETLGVKNNDATKDVAQMLAKGQSSAMNAIATIKTAINTVSETRARLGAWQNRLEHTINNLGVTNENITAAESRIRDTDMASEMMAFTKNNILNQAAQSMLAQANQVPQGVLQLLQ